MNTEEITALIEYFKNKHEGETDEQFIEWINS